MQNINFMEILKRPTSGLDSDTGSKIIFRLDLMLGLLILFLLNFWSLMQAILLDGLKIENLFNSKMKKAK